MRERPIVVLTGATGFIGSAISRRLRRDPSIELRQLVRERPMDDDGPPAGDIRDEASVTTALRGAEVLIHAASYVGPDSARAWSVNDQGAALLMAAATDAGVERIVSMSTAAVYGIGPHHRIEANESPGVPDSDLSASRLAGERHALLAGATVLRPNMIYGYHDRHVVPGVLAAALTLRAWVDDGAAEISVIDVDELARLTIALAWSPSRPNRVLHANHPEPVSTRRLLEACIEAGLPVAKPTESISYEQALERARRGSLPVTARQFQRFALEHTYDSTEAWQIAGLDPLPVLELSPQAIEWYQSLFVAPPEEPRLDAPPVPKPGPPRGRR
jgi:nucleoside-diphosphate-sugar epimerase